MDGWMDDYLINPRRNDASGRFSPSQARKPCTFIMRLKVKSCLYICFVLFYKSLGYSWGWTGHSVIRTNQKRPSASDQKQKASQNHESGGHFHRPGNPSALNFLRGAQEFLERSLKRLPESTPMLVRVTLGYLAPSPRDSA